MTEYTAGTVGVAGTLEPPAASVAALKEQLVRAHAEIAHLQTALSGSRIIGAAVGMVMERYTITADAAFAYLIRTSQDTNRKLRDVAADLVNQHS